MPPNDHAPGLHTQTHTHNSSPQAPSIRTLTQDITHRETYKPYAFCSKCTYYTPSAYTQIHTPPFQRANTEPQKQSTATYATFTTPTFTTNLGLALNPSKDKHTQAHTHTQTHTHTAPEATRHRKANKHTTCYEYTKKHPRDKERFEYLKYMKNPTAGLKTRGNGVWQSGVS